MTANEKRDAVYAKGLSRKGKNKYTQDPAKRTQVGSGYSDCSSFVRWCYLKTQNIDIGGNTRAQIASSKMKTVHQGGKYPPKGTIKKGDLLYFRGADGNVGHVEIFNGKSKLLGHGSGKGPTLKGIVTYCLYKASVKRKYMCTRRVIQDD